jgi:hypothetical protein
MQLHGDPNIARAAQFASLVLLYLEQTRLIPERFSQARQAAWRGMMPYLRELDLFELAVRDGARANPHLFAVFRETTTRNELRALNGHRWREELEDVQSLNLATMPVCQLYGHGAKILGVDLPPAETSPLKANSFDRSSLIAEVPNGCGYPSLLLCEEYDFLDPAHNLRIFVDGIEAEMLAALAMLLLTRQLTSPAGHIIPVSASDSTPLASEVFDAALIYRPVAWLSPLLRDTMSAREFVVL